MRASGTVSGYATEIVPRVKACSPDSRSRLQFDPESAAVEERWRLDAESAKVDVALAAMVNFVVDDIEDQVVQHARVLPEGGDRLEKSRRWNVRPDRRKLLGTFIPQ